MQELGMSDETFYIRKSINELDAANASRKEMAIVRDEGLFP